jgi:Flp pilus assembly protein TadB
METVNWIAIAALVLAFIANGVTAAAWVYTWNVNRNRATEKDLRRIGERLTVVEAAVAGLPTDDALHAVDKHLTEAVGELKAVNAKLAGEAGRIDHLERIVERIEQHILGKSK